MSNSDFATHLSTYFLKYMPTRTGYSSNTIESYRDTFIIFLRYCNDELRIKPEKINFTIINRNMVEDFLFWLEYKKKYAISTRNLRLAGLHAFFRYVQLESPEYMDLCSSILAIKSKKAPVTEMNYLSIEGIKLLLSMPDINLQPERRDLAVLALMYDTGGRVQEIADLQITDIRIKVPATIRLTGKGNKTRIIPLMPQTMSIMKKYMTDYGLNDLTKGPIPLFFNRRSEKLTRAGLSYILSKYAEKAMVHNKALFPNKISAHVLRHSKAMHLLQSGVNLIYIRDFLGHASVTTTELYAKSNPEIKRKAIEEASTKVLPKEKFSAEEKEDLFEWLKTVI
ncbi:MAG: integrase [Candidatus Schekmanbacteria bacterium RBG_13_48_7]|uniref:Integrase n=1 Tax=Candidatus Schekmanbacteria bacterium RBG_13_48_7 TaxID=1817878 RepID=A0A1F7RY75_9BACT|nr:MAG: integrase [Candidatus Schekmanbacteria bacterium RBG_13_48_7]